MGIDVIGVLGLLFLGISFFAGSVVFVRVFTMAAAFSFALYGLLLASWVVAAAGVLALVANAFFLRASLRQGRLECEYRKAEADLSDLVLRYLHFHQASILVRYPNFDVETLLKFWKEGGELYLALHKAKIRGVALWAPQGDEAVLVFEYIDPKYFHLGIEKKFYALLETFGNVGYRRAALDAESLSPKGLRYFRRKGFFPEKGQRLVKPFSIGGDFS